MKIKLTLLFFLFFSKSFSQKLSFDIFLFGNKIGQTVVEQNIKNDSITTYTLNSASEAHIFFTTRKLSLHYEIVYKHNQILSSYSKSIRNDEAHIVTIQRQNNIYMMNRDGVVLCIKPLQDCSTAKLFFHEPCNQQSVFSERLGENRPVKKTGESVYEVEMQEDVTYIYHYKNGKLLELEMRKGLLGSVYLRPALQ